MENLKIKVNNETESKEAQELFFELGYGWHGKGKLVSYLDKILSNDFGWLVLWQPPYLTNTVIQMGSGFEDCKEITLQELRDMVVLKRNSVEDANYECHGSKYYLTSDNKNHCWHKVAENGAPVFKWVHCGTPLSKEFKPIQKEKTMKEYLEKQSDGSYELVFRGDSCKSDDVEVPVGAEVYGRNKLSGMREFYKKGRSIYINRWSNGEWIESDYHFGNIDDIWSRAMQYKLDKLKSSQREKPQEKCADKTSMEEALEFAEELRNMGESGWSKEKHSHYKKDVSNLEFIDVYRVLGLFAVEHPCIQHAVKKLLCAGQRGSKGRNQDVQEAIDSLIRFQEMRKEDEL